MRGSLSGDRLTNPITHHALVMDSLRLFCHNSKKATPRNPRWLLLKNYHEGSLA
jgi:hypothetical protein